MVVGLNVVALDAWGTYEATEETREFSKRYKSRHEQMMRDKAAQRKVPSQAVMVQDGNT